MGLEAPSGFEPLHRGFADLSLSHLGTAPFLEQLCKTAYYCIGWHGLAQALVQIILQLVERNMYPVSCIVCARRL